MNDKFLININIAGKQYSLYINRNEHEEEIIRKAAIQINKQLEQYRTIYSASEVSERDLLAMVSLQLSKENLELEEKKSTEPFEKTIKESIHTMDNFLKDF